MEFNEYLGNYTYYTEKKKNPQRFETYEGLATGKTKTQLNEEKKKKKALDKEAKAKQNEIKTIENNISTNEEALEKLQEELCKEEIYSNPVESERVNKEIKVLEEIIEKLYEQWEESSN